MAEAGKPGRHLHAETPKILLPFAYRMSYRGERRDVRSAGGTLGQRHGRWRVRHDISGGAGTKSSPGLSTTSGCRIGPGSNLASIEAPRALKLELIEVKRLAVDQDGKMLVWTGDNVPAAPPASSQEREPLAYACTPGREDSDGAQRPGRRGVSRSRCCLPT